MQPQVVRINNLTILELKLLGFLMKISKKVVLVVLKSNNDKPFIIFLIISYAQAGERVRFVTIVWLKQKVTMVYPIKLFNSFPLNINK